MKRAAVGLAIAMAFVLGLVMGGMAEEPRTSEASRAGEVARNQDAGDADDGAPAVPESERPKRARVDPEAVAPGAATGAAAAEGELHGGQVTLFARAKHGDWELSTFSFEFGVRDDLGNELTRGDWELQYTAHQDSLRVRLGGDDTSTIQDLGPFTSWAAVLGDESALSAAAGEGAAAVVGHVYLVHTKDRNSDHMSLFRVVELTSGDQVSLEWVHWVPSRPSRVAELGLPTATQRNLGSALDGVRTARTAARREQVGDIADPADILLQIRTGAQGGNRSVISLGDPGSWRGVGRKTEPLTEPFDVTEVPERSELPRMFARGGFIPEGMALVIESADVYGDARGDSKGRGSVSVRVGTARLLQLGEEEGPAIDWFEGQVVLRPGQEDSVRIEVANSSAGALRLRGRFVPLDEASAIEERKLWGGEAPAGAARVIADLDKVRSSYLSEPRAVLQVRADHGGGNPNRVSLLGKASSYLDKLVNEPLAPGVEDLRDALGYVDGGRIPRGHAFVITRITYRCRTTNKSHGDAFVSVMGEKIAGVERGKGPATVESVWVGRIAVPSGSEKRVFVEAAYFSEVDATFEGELIATGEQ